MSEASATLARSLAMLSHARQDPGEQRAPFRDRVPRVRWRISLPLEPRLA